MNVVKGNLWDSKDQVILVTTNAFVKKNGELVMGRGAAKEAKEKYPLLPKILGEQIQLHFSESKKYGVLLVDQYRYLGGGVYKIHDVIGAFQVKYNWWEKADLDLIDYSCKSLVNLLVHFPYKTVSMNFPGIGNGGLNYEAVYDIVKQLPDTVTLYRKNDNA